MFQKIPSGEHYKQIERELASKNKPTSLSYEQLESLQEEYSYAVGYKTYTGYTLTQADADALNKWTSELNRTRCIKTREYLKDRRHQLFCIISQEIKIKTLVSVQAA